MLHNVVLRMPQIVFCLATVAVYREQKMSVRVKGDNDLALNFFFVRRLPKLEDWRRRPLVPCKVTYGTLANSDIALSQPIGFVQQYLSRGDRMQRYTYRQACMSAPIRAYAKNFRSRTFVGSTMRRSYNVLMI